MKQRHVLAVGVFDLFHIGHLRYLQYARAQGSYLTVAVSADAIVLAVKGKLPIIQEEQRMEIIQGLGWIDRVRPLPTSTDDTQAAADWISAWGVNHVVVGYGWAGSPRWERLTPVLVEKGISVDFSPQTDGVSTTQIVASIRGLKE